MPTEASEARIHRTVRLPQDLDLALMRFARDRGLVQETRTMNLESGRIMVLSVPNISEAIRVALEEFFEKEGKGR